MNIQIRPETPADYQGIAALIQAAFEEVAYSDHREQFMVERLRQSEAFVPQLSLVAQTDTGELVGHILMTRLYVQDQHQRYPGLALAPLSVLPAYQRQGVGTQLVKESHAIAHTLGYAYCVVIGHAGYYPRFGYERLSNYAIELPIKISDENSMILALVEEGLSGVRGQVMYAPEFFS